MVTPHHQQANQNVLHTQFGYHNPQSGSSSQDTTKMPSRYAHKFALVKSPKNLQGFPGDSIAGNFVTPTTLQQQKVQKTERHHRQRYIASTTTSSLIPNHGSPARKMLPTYDPRQNIIKRYTTHPTYTHPTHTLPDYEYIHWNNYDDIVESGEKENTDNNGAMFMTPLPIQLTPTNEPASVTTLRTVKQTVAGPTPPTTARQKAQMVRVLREKRKKILILKTQ